VRKLFLIWRDWDGPRVEAARVELCSSGLRADGVQIGVDPLPYRLDYSLDASDRWITAELELQAVGDGWSRRLMLRRSADGAWRAQVDAEGAARLPDPGGSLDGLGEALDCDIGFSPLTNAMPVAREDLARGPGAADFVMAWVAVPALTVEASPQRYEHVRLEADGAIVRYVDRGLFEGFTAELEYDRDGFVRVYPELARRVG
jgi:uncharacterized protein